MNSTLEPCGDVTLVVRWHLRPHVQNMMSTLITLPQVQKMMSSLANSTLEPYEDIVIYASSMSLHHAVTSCYACLAGPRDDDKSGHLHPRALQGRWHLRREETRGAKLCRLPEPSEGLGLGLGLGLGTS